MLFNFDEPGKRLKNFALIMAHIEALASVITGIIFICVDFEDFWWIGLIIIFGGLFLTWIGYLLIYAFGELVDKTCMIESYLKPSEGFTDTNTQANDPTNPVVDSQPIKYQRTLEQNEWRCSKCGAINQNFINTCSCGQTRLANAKAKASSTGDQSKTAGPNEWKCSKCGVINQNYVGTCGCGQTKAEN